MKILYLCADWGISLANRNGSACYVCNLAESFARCGHEVILVMATSEATEDLSVQVETLPDLITVDSLKTRLRDPSDGGPRWPELRIARALHHVWNNVAVEQLLADLVPRCRPDLIYERYSPFMVAGSLVAERQGIPHVLGVNAPLAWEGQNHRRQALPAASELLEEVAFDATGLIVTTCAELRDLLVGADVPEAKVKVVTCGVDTELFAPEGPSSQRRPAGQFVLGFVGSLKPWHGVEVLADAFRKLAHDPRFGLFVVGDGPGADIVDALALELPGRVTFVRGAPQSDIPIHLRAMDVAVAPYPPQERFYFSPLKVFEYMATGRAVVSSRIGQLDGVIRDGETGLLVPPGDADALAQATRRLADDEGLRVSLGANAAAEARREHTWTHRASAISDLIEAL